MAEIQNYFDDFALVMERFVDYTLIIKNEEKLREVTEEGKRLINAMKEELAKKNTAKEPVKITIKEVYEVRAVFLIKAEFETLLDVIYCLGSPIEASVLKAIRQAARLFNVTLV